MEASSPPLTRLPLHRLFSQFMRDRRSYVRMESFTEGAAAPAWEEKIELAVIVGHASLVGLGCVNVRHVSFEGVLNALELENAGDMIRALRGAGADLLQKPERGFAYHSVLHAAVRGSCRRGLPALLEGATVEQVNCQDSNLRTPLHLLFTILATADSNEEAPLLLVEAGADLTLEDSRSTTPLHYIRGTELHRVLERCVHDRESGLEELRRLTLTNRLARALRDADLNAMVAALDEGADVNEVRFTQLVSSQEVDLVDELLRRGAQAEKTDSWGNNMLKLACSVKNDYMVWRLLQHGAVPKPDRLARFPELLELVESLGDDREALVDRLEPFAWASLACWLLSRGRGIAVAEAALARCPDGIRARTLTGTTALHAAAEGGDIAAVEWLLRQGAEVNVRQRDGTTPLHMAFASDQVEMIPFLIDHGADPTAKSLAEKPAWGYRCEWVADRDIRRAVAMPVEEGVEELRKRAALDALARDCAAGNFAAVLRAMEAGLVRPGEAVGSYGRLPALHEAAKHGHHRIVRLLLAAVDVDLRSQRLESALHLACRFAQRRCALVLLEHGASLVALSARGFTPAQEAEREPNRDIELARILELERPDEMVVALRELIGGEGGEE